MYVVNSLMERLCTLNMANLLTRSHLLQSQYKTPWIMSRGRSRSHFGITEKPTRDCVLGFLYNNVGLGVGNFEGKIWTSKISITPLSLGASYLHVGNPCEYSHKPYVTGNWSHWSTLCRWQFVSIFIQIFLLGAARLFYFLSISTKGAFQPFKVIQGR